MGFEVVQVIVAPKRETREATPADWQDLVANVDGVEVVGRTTSRVQVQATPEAVHEVRRLFGDLCHVEEVAPRRRSAR